MDSDLAVCDDRHGSPISIRVRWGPLRAGLRFGRPMKPGIDPSCDGGRSSTDPTRSRVVWMWPSKTATIHCGSGTSDQIRGLHLSPLWPRRSDPFSSQPLSGASSTGCLGGHRSRFDRFFAVRRRGVEVEDLPTDRPRTHSPCTPGESHRFLATKAVIRVLTQFHHNIWWSQL